MLLKRPMIPEFSSLNTISIVSLEDTHDSNITIKKEQAEAKQNLIEPFYISMDLHPQNNTLNEPVLIDSGANLNILLYEVWEALGKPRLIPTLMCIQNFSKIKTPILGTIFMKICNYHVLMIAILDWIALIISNTL